MNRKPGQPESRAAFTIIELLTVLSIIVILISLLVPAVNKVKRYARDVKQKAQFHAIGIGLDQFAAEHDGYPPSDQLDETGATYCGAMKLAEALVGQDLRGFHPDSRFRRYDRIAVSPVTPDYYYMNTAIPAPGPTQAYTDYMDNMKRRKMYIQLDNANAYQLDAIYDFNGPPAVGELQFARIFVLCDVYTRATNRQTGKRVGMPILYYKANTNRIQHIRSIAAGDLDLNIYDARDNAPIIDIPLPWTMGAGMPKVHPMARDIFGLTTTAGVSPDASIFYEKTRNPQAPTVARPYREDSFVLMSAGFDGEYGTGDDIYNFGD